MSMICLCLLLFFDDDGSFSHIHPVSETYAEISWVMLGLKHWHWTTTKLPG